MVVLGIRFVLTRLNRDITPAVSLLWRDLRPLTTATAHLATARVVYLLDFNGTGDLYYRYGTRSARARSVIVRGWPRLALTVLAATNLLRTTNLLASWLGGAILSPLLGRACVAW